MDMGCCCSPPSTCVCYLCPVPLHTLHPSSPRVCAVQKELSSCRKSFLHAPRLRVSKISFCLSSSFLSSNCTRKETRPLPHSSSPRFGAIEREQDEEWQQQRRQETKELERLRKLEDEEEEEKTKNYRQISLQLQNFSKEDIRQAKALVSSLIKSGEEIEEKIVEAADNGELTMLVLLVIQNRLELARHDDERDVVQALDLLQRRVEAEMMERRASPALQFLNELLNLHDGFSHAEWIRRCRQCMLKIFPSEDAFTVLAPLGFDLSSQKGPIDMPEEDDTILLRADFIREVDELLKELEAQSKNKPVEGMDPQSVAVRLGQQQKEAAIQQVRDLRKLAATLKW